MTRLITAALAALAITVHADDAAKPVEEAPAETETPVAPAPPPLTIRVTNELEIAPPRILYIDNSVACRVDDAGDLHCTAAKPEGS